MKKVEINTVDEVSKNQLKGVYGHNFNKPRILLTKSHILDDSMSVKWNDNKREAINKATLEHNEFLTSGTLVGSGDFEEDLITAISKEYSLNKAQAEIAYQMANEEGHSGGNHEIINYAYDFADFARSIVNAK